MSVSLRNCYSTSANRTQINHNKFAINADLPDVYRVNCEFLPK